MTKKPIMTPAMLAAEALGIGASAGAPGAIEASEAAGQKQLVESTDMPLELSGMKYGENGKPLFEQAGFTFGAKIDDLFQQATLPPGWRREATGHSMWSDILDEHGRKRVSVFYKAAFYDRKAHARLNHRYHAGIDYDCDPKSRPTRACIFDQGVAIAAFPIEDPESYNSGNAAEKAAVAELNARFPDWLNPLAYWDAADKAEGVEAGGEQGLRPSSDGAHHD